MGAAVGLVSMSRLVTQEFTQPQIKLKELEIEVRSRCDDSTNGPTGLLITQLRLRLGIINTLR